MNKLTTPRVLVLATVAFVTMTACAATRTQKSAGQGIDDAVIVTQIKSALIGDPVTRARDIDVEVFKGRVQLNGFIDSDSERQRAISLARKVKGVMNVDDNLKLKGNERRVGEVIDDATLTTKVKAALVADGRTKAYQISVDTRDSVVLLSGFVAATASRTAAGEVAAGISGVKSVDNQIAIK